jgi:hypothetical protein
MLTTNSAAAREEPHMRNDRQSSPVPEGRAWALNRLAYWLFTKRWFWLGFGLFVGGVSVPIMLAGPYHFHSITGAVARYSFADGSLRLVGDRTGYFFVPDNFPLPLPAHIPSETSVTIWIDGSNPDVDALQLIGQDGTPQATYKDIFIANPARQEAENRIFGAVFSTIGIGSFLGSLLWPLRKRTSRRTDRPYLDASGLWQGCSRFRAAACVRIGAEGLA